MWCACCPASCVHVFSLLALSLVIALQVTSVEPSVVDAVALQGSSRPRSVLTLHGVNFCTPDNSGQALNHTVVLGQQACMVVVWASDSEVSCALDPGVEFAVGRYNLSLTVGGQPSLPVGVEVQCPEGTYGRPGDLCTPCPAGAVCKGRSAEPVSSPG